MTDEKQRRQDFRASLKESSKIVFLQLSLKFSSCRYFSVLTQCLHYINVNARHYASLSCYCMHFHIATSLDGFVTSVT